MDQPIEQIGEDINVQARTDRLKQLDITDAQLRQQYLLNQQERKVLQGLSIQSETGIGKYSPFKNIPPGTLSDLKRQDGFVRGHFLFAGLLFLALVAIQWAIFYYMVKKFKTESTIQIMYASFNGILTLMLFIYIFLSVFKEKYTSTLNYFIAIIMIVMIALNGIVFASTQDNKDYVVENYLIVSSIIIGVITTILFILLGWVSVGARLNLSNVFESTEQRIANLQAQVQSI